MGVRLALRFPMKPGFGLGFEMSPLVTLEVYYILSKGPV